MPKCGDCKMFMPKAGETEFKCTAANMEVTEETDASKCEKFMKK